MPPKIRFPLACFTTFNNNLGISSGTWILGTELGESDWHYGMGATDEENLAADEEHPAD